MKINTALDRASSFAELLKIDFCSAAYKKATFL